MRLPRIGRLFATARVATHCATGGIARANRSEAKIAATRMVETLAASNPVVIQ